MHLSSIIQPHLWAGKHLHEHSPDLRHLHYFVVVADELHFTRAADRLDISQPSLSQAIHDLEDILGARLFVRSNRRVTLTLAGKAFLEDARDILGRLEIARRKIQQLRRGELGILRLGMTMSTMLAGPLPRAIARFRQALPQADMELLELNSSGQLTALEQAEIDVGIMRVESLPDTLCSQLLYNDPLAVVLPVNHPLLAEAKTDGVDPARLQEELFIRFQHVQGAGIEAQSLRLCQAAGFTPRVVQQAREASTVLGLVAAGLGIAFLPQSFHRWQSGEVRFVPLRSPEAASPVHVVYRQGARLPLLGQFLSFLQAELVSYRDTGLRGGT